MIKKFDRSKIWNLIKFLLAIVLVIFVVKKTDFSYITQLSGRFSWSWFAIRVVLFFILTALKALQYYALISKVRYRDVLNIVVWQNAISNLVSNSAGIASYMTMFKTEQKVNLTRSGATFLIVKFGDLLAICLYLILSASIVWKEIQSLRWLTILLISGMLFGLGIFFITMLWRERFVYLIERILTWLKLDRFSLTARGLKLLHSLADEEQDSILRMLKTGVLTSLLYMTITMFFGYSEIGLFNLPVTMWGSIYITSLNQLVSFIPIQVLGGLGIAEVTLVYLYGIFGVPQAEMSGVALALRALFYLMNIAAFLYLPIGAFLKKRLPNEN